VLAVAQESAELGERAGADHPAPGVAAQLEGRADVRSEPLAGLVLLPDLTAEEREPALPSGQERVFLGHRSGGLLELRHAGLHAAQDEHVDADRLDDVGIADPLRLLHELLSESLRIDQPALHQRPHRPELDGLRHEERLAQLVRQLNVHPRLAVGGAHVR
jgi:hypothetical protein